MAVIQMTEALSSALIARFQTEYGQQAVSNFALDILLDSANAEVLRLTQVNAALSEKLRAAEQLVETMKQENDPRRAETMGAADAVRQRKQERHGANTHTK